ncbi:phosphotransferase enzyme family protein [Cohnella nanjingensis]|nr:phosphotransferase [Cohnella nanjingensis]
MKALFTAQIVAEAAQRYSFKPNELRLLGNNQNYTFGNSNYIIRITHSSHRCRELIQGELEWIQYLADKNVPVSSPVKSVNGERIEMLDGFIVVAFDKALGSPWTDAITQNEEFEKLGSVIGRMHAVTKNYIPSSQEIERFTWDDNALLRDFMSNVPTSQELVITHFESLMQRVRKLPRECESFGLIHGDFCFGNYAVQPDGNITVFDFDECQYGWFMQDIAVNLFYGIAVPNPNEDVVSFARRYLTSFFEGYYKENRIDYKLLQDLPLFLDMRQVILYSALYRNGNLGSLDYWSQEFLKRARHNMENNLSMIEMDILNF